MSLVETRTPTFAAAAPTAPKPGLAPSVVVGLGVYLVLICAGSQLLNDPDTQWHIAVGQWIWANGRVPTTDVFSHTFQGAPWIAKEWGSQLLLFAAFHFAGWSGVVCLSAAAIAATFAMLYAWLQQRLRSSVALALTLVAALLCAPHLLARPHALVLPVMMVWVFGLLAAREREEAPSLALALLMVLWTNLHGSFPLGLMLAGLLGAEGVLLGCRVTFATRLRAWAPFLVAAAAATLASPFGWHALLVPLQMAGKNGEALPFIAEWQPLGFEMSSVIASGLLAAMLWALASAPLGNAFRIVAVLLLAAMMFRHSRFLDQFALLAPLFCATAFARRSSLAPIAQAEAPRALTVLAGVAALAASILTVRATPVPDPKMAPEAALRAALARHVEGPVYNAYDFGGFLIAHNIPTFVDGRTDQLFLGGFLTALDEARRDKKDQAFAALLSHHHVTWALVRPHSADSRHFTRLAGWSEVYADSVSEVFVKGR